MSNNYTVTICHGCKEPVIADEGEGVMVHGWQSLEILLDKLKAKNADIKAVAKSVCGYCGFHVDGTEAEHIAKYHLHDDNRVWEQQFNTDWDNLPELKEITKNTKIVVVEVTKFDHEK